MESALIINNQDNSWDNLQLLDASGSLPDHTTPIIQEWDINNVLESYNLKLLEDCNYLKVHVESDEDDDLRIFSSCKFGEITTNILPGSVQLRSNGSVVTVSNHTPHLLSEHNQVFLDGIDISDYVEEFFLEIDPIRNIINAYLIYVLDDVETTIQFFN